MMSQSCTRCAGVFLPPFIAMTKTRSCRMKRDFQLMQWLDAHNYSEHGSASTIRTVTRFTASPNCSSPPQAERACRFIADSKASDLRADGSTGWSTTEWDREVVDEFRFISPLLLIIPIDGPRERDRGRCPV
jgi:hypothetical protein